MTGSLVYIGIAIVDRSSRMKQDVQGYTAVWMVLESVNG